MSFQAYLDAIETKTGKTPQQLVDEAHGEDHAPERALGVTALDLFIPALSFVFGEAQLGGTAAVVSLHRLRAESYGLRPDPALLFERLVKEALHELGHTHGLVHCQSFDCVMRSSTYVEDIDQKPQLFCDSCWTRLPLAR